MKILIELEAAIFALPDMYRGHDSWALLEDDERDGNVLYVKFMSDQGLTDVNNGVAFRGWLVEQNIPHTYNVSYPRVLIVLDRKMLQEALHVSTDS